MAGKLLNGMRQKLVKGIKRLALGGNVIIRISGAAACSGRFSAIAFGLPRRYCLRRACIASGVIPNPS